MRLGPGPVFAYEWLTSTRRWQLYAMRAGFVATILVGMMIVWRGSNPSNHPGQVVSLRMLATCGEYLYKTTVSIELTLVLLAAPAATAGAICLDKARGTLDHMLATDLSNSEIVLGKFGVRLVPVLGLIACVLPVAALAGLLGGIDPIALLGSFVTAIACAILSCSLAMTLSVWGRKTHEVLMLTYLILILWLIIPELEPVIADVFGTSLRQALPEWTGYANPYDLAFAPYSNPGAVGVTTYFAFLGVCLLLSTLMLTLATLRVRGVALKQAGRPAARARQSWFFRHFSGLSWRPSLPGPSLDGNPVLWREWHRARPTKLMRVVWMLYTALGLLGIAAAFKVDVLSPGNQEMIAVMSTFQVTVGLLLLSVSAATSLADERAQGSLDLLLGTPLSTSSILVGKWLAAFRQATRIAIWPAILAGMLVMRTGHWISYFLLLGLVVAYCAVITSLGLLAATWFSRVGRAVAVCVSAYVVFSIGWIVLAELFNSQIVVPMWSPPWGTMLATMNVAPDDIDFASPNEISTGALFWIVVSVVVAFSLFLITLSTFDLCLGRVSEMTTRPIPGGKRYATVDLDIDAWFYEHPEDISQSVD